MPKILRKQLREKPINYKHECFDNGKFYQSIAWKRLRNVLFSQSPICKECLKRGIVTPSTDAHHIRPFSTGKDEQEQWQLFLDEKNIYMCCSPCHQAYHRKIKRYNLLSCNDLTDTEWKEAHSNIF